MVAAILARVACGDAAIGSSCADAVCRDAADWASSLWTGGHPFPSLHKADRLGGVPMQARHSAGAAPL